MGLLSKLFGKKEEPKPELTDDTKELLGLTGCEWEVLSPSLSSKDLTQLYLTGYSKGRAEGWFPVILAAGETVHEMIECNFEENGGVQAFREKMPA